MTTCAMGAEKVSFKSGWVRLLNTNIGKQKDRSHRRQLSRTHQISFADAETSQRSRGGTENIPFRFTRKDGRTLYAISLEWPGSKLRLRTVQPEEGSKITMLGVNTPLQWSNEGGQGISIDIPADLQSDGIRLRNVAWAFKIEPEND